ncbi:hypothetical protein Tsubulata_006845 [Turnera subulata]|uniref:F-box domain-containing protein n=1 Tax=Turnera subulata TaxID=218843 RepID=A0A9Q0GB31_9ROSI|nr:hypothetical protein Tsubulata_006845 [Turnera subulata]
MADRRSMLSSSSSKEQKREEGSDDTAAMEMKHNNTRAPDNRLLTDQAKPIDIEQLVISTNMAAPNRSYVPPDIVEEILDLLPSTSINRFRSVSKSLFSLLAIKFNVPKLLYHPYRIPSSSMYGIKSSDDQGLFIGVALSDYSGDVNNRGYMAPELSGQGGDGPKVEIFSLKTGSWKKLENPDEYFQYIEHLQRFKSIEETRYLEERNMGLFLNGALHWGWANSLRSAQKNNEIIAFGLDKERFYHVPNPPNQISPGSGSCYSVGVVGEYLTLLFKEGQKNYIVWVMKEYCNEASWVPFISYSSCGNVWDGGRVEFVCNFIPRSFKDGIYMMLQFAYVPFALGVCRVTALLSLTLCWQASEGSMKRILGYIEDDLVSTDFPENQQQPKKIVVLVDHAKPMERLVISTNMAAPNRSSLPPDIVEEILDLLPKKSLIDSGQSPSGCSLCWRPSSTYRDSYITPT